MVLRKLMLRLRPIPPIILPKELTLTRQLRSGKLTKVTAVYLDKLSTRSFSALEEGLVLRSQEVVYQLSTQFVVDSTVFVVRALHVQFHIRQITGRESYLTTVKVFLSLYQFVSLRPCQRPLGLLQLPLHRHPLKPQTRQWPQQGKKQS